MSDLDLVGVYTSLYEFGQEFISKLGLNKVNTDFECIAKNLIYNGYYKLYQDDDYIYIYKSGYKKFFKCGSHFVREFLQKNKISSIISDNCMISVLSHRELFYFSNEGDYTVVND